MEIFVDGGIMSEPRYYRIAYGEVQYSDGYGWKRSNLSISEFECLIYEGKIELYEEVCDEYL